MRSSNGTPQVLAIQKYRGHGIAAPYWCVFQLDQNNSLACAAGVRRTESLEDAHNRRSLAIFALSLGELTCVRRLRWSVDALAQMVGLTADAGRGLRLGSMSSGWLRQYESDVEKHGRSA